MNIGIYGGSFNPPHLGHMGAARAAIEALDLDKLILIPAKTPPHKALAENSATPEQRLEMTRMMADGLLLPGKAEADGLELEREGPSYTVDTLRELKERYPNDRLWLLVGTDMFLSLQDWRQADVILSLAGVGAFSRSLDDSDDAMNAQARFLEETFGTQVRLISLPQVREISSTQIREEGTGEGLWSPIWGYILRNGLYGTGRDLKHLSDDDLRSCSLSMVYARRHAHILGVEEEAVRLARRWGADEADARRAGILHDCTKYLPAREQLSCCEQYGIPVDDLERANAKILHAKTGAAVARAVYGVNDRVYEAIRWHTTGHSGMTLLEKILYVADYMEPNRDFDGVEELRRLAYTDLDGAMILGLRMSIDDLAARNLVIHRDTQGALDDLLEKRKGNGTGQWI